MALFQPERCYACQKLFCCGDCCVNHIKNKHPGRESQCPLCRYEPLIIRKFEHEQFLCHIVFNHLPLHCRKCGELFENVEDLKAISTCGRHPLIILEPPTFIELSKSTSTINTPSSFNKTPCQPSLIDNKEISIDGGYNKNFVNFTSPPELTRNTSTPMHIGIMKKNYNLQRKAMSKVPNIILTTPSFSSKKNDSNISNASVATSNCKLNEAESIYCSLRSSVKSNSLDNSALKSILSMKSMSISNGIDQQRNHSRNVSDKKLASMEEVDENEIDMELTDVHGAIFTGHVTPPDTKNISTHQELKDSGKRVRFIDQYHNVTPEFDNKHDVSEAEEFFEAHQSLGETSLAHSDDLNTKNSSGKILNEEVIDNHNSDGGIKEETKNSDSSKSQGIKSQSSSRVVMMVVVEQIGDDQSTDLAPLTDSSLKKLTSVLSKSTPIQNNSTDINNDQSKNIGKISIVSVDTYTSLSTIECIKAPDIELISPKNRSMTPNINLSGSGIFSAVANAVRSAFTKLSGAALVKKPTTETRSSKDISQLASTSQLNTSDKSLPSSTSSSGIIANSTMNSSSRPGKRSRDEVDSISFELPEVSDIQKNTYDNENDIRSPLQKRQCGWYRQIRGREPIARMKKSYSSPRGISLEKQCFQQGSLTVGETILPLPSRAHQSTQTD